MKDKAAFASHTSNRELSSLLTALSRCYRYLGNEHRFRAAAYERAAKTIAAMKEPVVIYKNHPEKLDQLKGIGESIAAKIIEYLNTGSMHTLEELKKQVPVGLLDLMDIRGIGPAVIQSLQEQLHIHDIKELHDAAAAGKLNNIKGIPAATIAALERSLKLPSLHKQRLPFSVAHSIATALLQSVVSIRGVKRASIAGSIRREKKTIGDIDMVATAPLPLHQRIIQQFIRLPMVEKVLSAGKTSASVLLKEQAVQADIRVVNEEEYGAAMLYFTGSREHTIQLRNIARKKGWKMNEYGVFKKSNHKKLAGETEEGIYQLFGLQFIPPDERIGADELKHAK